MNAVIDGIAGEDQSDRWDVKARRIIRVRMPYSHNDQFASFQIDLIALQRIRDGYHVWNLIWEQLAPSVIQFLRRDLKLHFRDDLRRRQRLKVRESVLQNLYSEKMIAMCVSDVNCLQCLSARDNRVCQTFGLIHRKEGIDENRVVLSVDQRRRIGDPHQGLLTGRHFTVEAGTRGGKHLVAQRGCLTL